MTKQVKSVGYYLLHNMKDKSYNRVLKASIKYPNASLYELQHGVKSKASQKYRARHKEPEIVEEWLPEIRPKLTMYCYRDFLESEGSDYYGVTLYFTEYNEMKFFERARDHIAEELELHMNLQYYRSKVSTTEGYHEKDFQLEIGELDTGEIRYTINYHNGVMNEDMFDDFDSMSLKQILEWRDDART